MDDAETVEQEVAEDYNRRRRFEVGHEKYLQGVFAVTKDRPS